MSEAMMNASQVFPLKISTEVGFREFRFFLGLLVGKLSLGYICHEAILRILHIPYAQIPYQDDQKSTL